MCTDCAVNTYNALTAKTAEADCKTCGTNAASALASSAKTSCTCNAGYWGPLMGDAAESLTCTACVAGKIGSACGGSSDDAACDNSPGAGDGDCDACRITGGESTENEMFILLGQYFMADGSGG